MLLGITNLARAADSVDLTDLTTAVRTGPAYWVDGGLEVPFDRALTAAEVDAVTARLVSRDDPAEKARRILTDYLALGSPTQADSVKALRVVCRSIVYLIDRQL